MKLNSTVRLTSDGTVQRVDLTYDVQDGDAVEVYFGAEEILTGWTLQRNTTPQHVDFTEKIPAGTEVLIRRYTDMRELPHLFHFTGNARGGAEFNAKNLDDNFDKIKRAAQDAMDSFELVGINLEAAQRAADAAAVSAAAAQVSEQEAETSATAAAGSATTAQGAASTATTKASEASASASAATVSESNASVSASLAKDWATKTGGTVDGTDYSAKYWAGIAEGIVTADTYISTVDSTSISFSGKGSSGDPLSAEVTVSDGEGLLGFGYGRVGTTIGRYADVNDVPKRTGFYLLTDGHPNSTNNKAPLAGFYDTSILRTLRQSSNDFVDLYFPYHQYSNGMVIAPHTSSGYTTQRIVSDSVNLRTSTGSSTIYPMSQKAVTDALATKVNTTQLPELKDHQSLNNRNTPNAHDASAISRGVVVVDSIADLLALPEDQRREDLRYLVKGYHTGSDVGGGVFYWDAARLGHDGGALIHHLRDYPLDWEDEALLNGWFADEMTTQGAFVRVTGESDFNIADYGAGGDTLHSSLLNAVFSVAAKKGVTPISSHSFTLIGGSCYLKSGFIGKKTIYVDKSRQNGTPFVFEEDSIISGDFSTISAYTQAGDRNFNGALSAYPNHIFRIESDDILCNRYVSSGTVQYLKEDNNLITASGNLVRPLEHTYTNAKLVEFRYSAPSEIKLDLRFIGSAAGGSNIGTAVMIQRSYVSADITISNSTLPYLPLVTGCSVSYCGNTTVTGSTSGTDTPELGYGFLAMHTYGITFKDVRTTATRKSVDMRFATDTKVLGGDHEAPIASHLSYGLLVKGATCRGGWLPGQATQSVIWVVGKDIKIIDNDLHGGPISNTRFVNIRDDIPIRYGSLIVEGNRCYATTSLEPNAPRMVSVGVLEDFDYGATLGMFDEIIVRNNTINNTLSGTDNPQAVNLDNRNTINPASWPHIIRVEGETYTDKDGVRYPSVTVRSYMDTPLPVRAAGEILLDGVGRVYFGIEGVEGGYDLNIRNLIGDLAASHTARSIRITGGLLRHLIDMSSLTYIQPPQGKLVWISDMTVDPRLKFSYHDVGFCFSRCEFLGQLSISDSSYIALSSSNFGVAQSLMALDGVYNNSGA